MWNDDANRMAILELHHSGTLRRRERQHAAWAWLSELPWTTRTRRRNEIAVVGARHAELEAMLDTRWPEWREVARRLAEAGLPITHSGWKRLEDEERATASVHLPQRLHHKTAAAQIASHSKAALTGTRRGALKGVALTHDGIVRLRPNPGLVLRAGPVEIEAARVAAVTGEVVLTERALLDGTRLSGTPPTAVILVENLGPFVDMAVPDGWMAMHVPGWNTSTARRLLDGIDASIELVHFGDLDPEGVQIANHLRTNYPRLRWAVPDFWRECIPMKAQTGKWPRDENVSDGPALVQELKQSGLWLEQETISLDPRLPDALEDVLRAIDTNLGTPRCTAIRYGEGPG